MMRHLIVPLALTLAGYAHSEPAPQPANDSPPPALVLPDDVRKALQQSGKPMVVGVYRTCLDTSGHVVSVAPVENQGIPGADEAIVAQIRTWPHKPQAIPICFVSRAVFHFDSPPAAAQADAPPSKVDAPAPPKPRYRNVPPHLFNTRKISGDMPQLPERLKKQLRGRDATTLFKVYVEPDGTVSRAEVQTSLGEEVDEVVQKTLLTWRYRPDSLPMCTVIRFVFSLGR